MSINFQEVRIAAEANAESLLSEWYPSGRKQGVEFCVGDVSGSAPSGGGSMKYNLRKNVWSDFATGESGDIIDLLATKDNLTVLEAANALSERLKLGSLDGSAMEGKFQAKVKPLANEWVSTRNVPDHAPSPPESHPYHGIPSKVWTYTNDEGEAIGYIYRFDTKDGKDVIPLTWCENQMSNDEAWKWKQFQKPRPLYNLYELQHRPDAKVLIVEGEKAADAAKLLCPNAVVITWSGGTNAVNMADWSPLEDRVVLIWPDEDHKVYKETDIPARGCKVGDEKIKEDQPGFKAALKIKELIPSARIIETSGKHADGWDAADALEQGAKPEQVENWIGIGEEEGEGTYVPANRQMERAILNGAIYDAGMGRLLAEGCCVEWFSEKDHKLLWRVSERIFKLRSDIDPTLLKSELHQMVRLGEWGGDPDSLVSSIKCEGKKYEAYIILVKEEFQKRQLLKLMQSGVVSASMASASLKEIKESLGETLNKIFSVTATTGDLTAKDRIDNLITRKMEEASGRTELVPDEYKVYLGIEKAEKDLGYIDRRNGDNLIVIGAATSCGKSALMRQILMANLVAHPDWVMAAFLLESSIEDFAHNAACSAAGFDTRSEMVSVDGPKQKAYFDYLHFILEQVDERVFLFDSNASVEDIRLKCSEIKAKKARFDMCMVDYIQIAEGKGKGNRETEVAGISKGLKNLQKDMECPVFSGTQLNENGRARESRAVENDATIFWVMERPDETPNGSPQGEGFMNSNYFQTLRQTKSRNGKKVTVKVDFQVTTQRIRDWI